MGPTYKYSPLNAEKEEIRLLRLLPGVWESSIVCKTFTVSLSDQPEYAALSYVWGSKENQQIVTLDGCPFYVNLNLFTALRRLRAHNDAETGIIWIDAICINQDDSDEKAWQVELMGSIYKSCSQVYIWLGEWKDDISEDEQRCIQFSYDDKDFGENWEKYLKDFGLKPHGAEVPDFSGINITVGSQINTTFHLAWFIRIILSGGHITKLPPFSSEELLASYRTEFHRAVVQLAENPYFQRMWIVQETALAPSALVMFSAYKFPLEKLTEAFNLLQSHRQEKCCEASSYVCLEVWDSLRHSLSKFRTILYHRERVLKREPTNLFSLCMMHGTRKASVRVDRVYAILSLVTNWSGKVSIKPNYSYEKIKDSDAKAEAEATTIALVYAQVSKEYLENKSNRWLKFPIISSTRKSRNSKMPSWAMDWDDFESSKSAFWDKQVLFYKAHSNWIWQCAVNSENVLITPAFPISTISKVGKELEADYEKVDSINETFENWRELIPRQGELETPYHGAGTWSHAWWRTLSGDFCQASDGSLRRLTDDDVEAFANAIYEGVLAKIHISPENTPQESSESQATPHASTNDPMVVHRNHLLKVMVISMFDKRRLFITNSGHLGFGRQDIQAGDEIFIVPGAYTPCVLRRTEKKLVLGKDVKHEVYGYNAIGGCYVHGFMDGEAVNDENLKKMDVYSIV